MCELRWLAALLMLGVLLLLPLLSLPLLVLPPLLLLPLPPAVAMLPLLLLL